MTGTPLTRIYYIQHAVAAVLPLPSPQPPQKLCLQSENKMKLLPLTMKLPHFLKNLLNQHHLSPPRLNQPPLSRQEEGEVADVPEAVVVVVVVEGVVAEGPLFPVLFPPKI